MSKRCLFFAVSVSVFGLGCSTAYLSAPDSQVALATTQTTPSSNPNPNSTATTQPPSPTISSQPAVDSKANLHLDEIPPHLAMPILAEKSGTTASLEALRTYAQARSAIVDNNRVEAIRLLVAASKLDPDSYDIFHDLGRLFLSGGNTVPPMLAMDAMERASVLRPDNLQLHYELGRHYLERNNFAGAIHHFRMARLTTDYRQQKNIDTSVMLDFFLGRVLRVAGYQTAALEVLMPLYDRMKNVGSTSRSNPEFAFFVRSPQLLYSEIAEIYEVQGNHRLAIETYRKMQEFDPENDELQRRLARHLAASGQVDEALSMAETFVSRKKGTGDSLKLLSETCITLQTPNAYGRILAKLHRKSPQDRLIFYALLDELKTSGKHDQAQSLLMDAVKDNRSDLDYTRRLFAVYLSHGQSQQALRLLVDAVAVRPDSLRDLGPLWTELLKPQYRSQVRIAALQQMKVPASEEPARLYWVSQLAELWDRDALARSSIEQAASIQPPFAPVYRKLIADVWSRNDWDENQKAEACEAQAKKVESQGDKPLAAELRGRSLIYQNKLKEAADQFVLARTLGNSAPDLRLMQIQTIIRQGEEIRAEQELLNLSSDWPNFEDAYGELFGLYLRRKNVDSALATLKKWLAAVPNSVNGRLLEASVNAQSGQIDALNTARSILQGLFDEQPENLQVLQAIGSFYRNYGKVDDFIGLLEKEQVRNPGNREALEILVTTYAEKKRVDDARKALDAARASVARDPDLLYFIAHLYERIDQKNMTEEVLKQVIDIDARHVSASNDLGYSWADEGRNLDQAEKLVRVAVDAEPDNQSYLDSLAWVEYKRGKFNDAHKLLIKAIGPANRPDPAVLDHLGDVLFQLQKPQDASRQWERSLQRIGQMSIEFRSDLQKLKSQLESKIKAVKQGGKVEVAPVLELSNNGR